MHNELKKMYKLIKKEDFNALSRYSYDKLRKAYDGVSLIELCSLKNNIQGTTWLIEQGIIAQKSARIAAKYGYIELLEQIITLVPKQQVVAVKCLAVVGAAESGRLELVDYLLSIGASIGFACNSALKNGHINLEWISLTNNEDYREICAEKAGLLNKLDLARCINTLISNNIIISVENVERYLKKPEWIQVLSNIQNTTINEEMDEYNENVTAVERVFNIPEIVQKTSELVYKDTNIDVPEMVYTFDQIHRNRFFNINLEENDLSQDYEADVNSNHRHKKRCTIL